jgi:DNA (cytosine-5)-methyltransferase 1
MEIRCEEIIVKDRYRKDLGNLDELMESIKAIGLLQPIGITKDKELIFGYRRLQAHVMLGFDEIEARIVEVPSITEGEYVENEFRKNFNVSERVAIGKALEDGIRERRGGNHGNQYSSAKPKKADSQNELSGKETREIAAGVAGFGCRENYRKAKVIVDKGAPVVIEKVDNKKISINAAYKEIIKAEKKQQRAKENESAAKLYKEDDSLRIVNADFYPWCNENLDPGSVDVIITDPPYSKEYLHVWEQLSEVAKRVLKPGGYLIAYSGQLYLDRVKESLGKHMSYCWMISLYQTQATQIVHPRNVVCTWKPILIYRNGAPGKIESCTGRALVDSFMTDFRDKDFHEWGQGESAVGYLMKIFSNPNELVLEPFAGGGTTLAVAKALKRRCVGIEKDPQYMDVIKSRLLKSGENSESKKENKVKSIDSDAPVEIEKKPEYFKKTKRKNKLMKALNLYAGVGGNRKLWEDVEVTAVEGSKEIAEAYHGFYPDDTLVIGDAVEYLMKNYKKFDFIWVSPPCQSHSRVRHIGLSRTKAPYDPVLPDFTLYALVVWFQHHFNDKLWCVENVNPYYEPLLPPTVKLDRHLFWSNFPIQDKKFKKPEVRHNDVTGKTVRYGIDVRDKKFRETPKSVVIKNCVDPDMGDYILNAAKDYISLN